MGRPRRPARRAAAGGHDGERSRARRGCGSASTRGRRTRARVHARCGRAPMSAAHRSRLRERGWRASGSPPRSTATCRRTNRPPRTLDDAHGRPPVDLVVGRPRRVPEAGPRPRAAHPRRGDGHPRAGAPVDAHLPRRTWATPASRDGLDPAEPAPPPRRRRRDGTGRQRGASLTDPAFEPGYVSSAHLEPRPARCSGWRCRCRSRRPPR